MDEGAEPQRLRIVGLHHITLISSDLERSVGFYRDLLGMRLVKQTRNSDDPTARHFHFGDGDGGPGTIVSCLEYPRMRPGETGIGSTHHFALAVESESELAGWREYLISRGVPCSELLDRTYCKSLYLRDPDGHIIEIATRSPGFTVDEPADQLGTRMIEPR